MSAVRDDLPDTHPAGTDEVGAALRAIYNWSYEPELDALRTLYANALERQWISVRDLDWERGVDREAFSETFSLGGLPVARTEFWRSLPAETRWEVARRSASFLLSNFLHGEQGALMVAGQLVSAVPHMDGKFYAATQTLDEARHVEAFAAYVRLLDDVTPISPGLKRLLDNVLGAEDWRLKAVGMQVVAEGLALYTFRDMRNTTREPLLQQLLTYVARDEARHTGYGIKYLSAVVPQCSEAERTALEDFAFESARLLIDSRAGLSLREQVLGIWRSAGVDPVEAMQKLSAERDVVAAAMAKSGGRLGPVSGFVIPTLRAIGLYSDRIRAHFAEMFEANVVVARTRNPANASVELPDDLEAWVNEGYEAL
ncbi:MAG TPA: ferritin-like domain-containing protein [Myxococcota bacterium]|nr:ferritin-like domain-containing protein [Myxococcota bacterium]